MVDVHVSVVGNPDDSVVVALRGNLDLDSAPVLSTTLDQVLDRSAPHVVIDLSGVEFCDSTGLSAFVVGHNRARADGGWLRLAGAGDFLGRLLDTVGLTTRMSVYRTVGDALAERDMIGGEQPGSDEIRSEQTGRKEAGGKEAGGEQTKSEQSRNERTGHEQSGDLPPGSPSVRGA